MDGWLEKLNTMKTMDLLPMAPIISVGLSSASVPGNRTLISYIVATPRESQETWMWDIRIRLTSHIMPDPLRRNHGIWKIWGRGDSLVHMDRNDTLSLRRLKLYLLSELDLWQSIVVYATKMVGLSSRIFGRYSASFLTSTKLVFFFYTDPWGLFFFVPPKKLNSITEHLIRIFHGAFQKN